MRLLPTYKHEFETVAEARDFMQRRSVEDVPVKAGESLEFEGDLVKIAGRDPIKMSPAFLRAFCGYMDPQFPMRYAAGIPADMFEYNANRLMRYHENKGATFQARIERWADLDGNIISTTASSLVSEAYQFVDHERILDAAAAISPENGGVTLTNEFLRIKTTSMGFNVTEAPAQKGDFRLGYELVNSETRRHAVSVSMFLLQLICTNGAVRPMPGFGGSFSRKHISDPDETMKQVEELIRSIDWNAGAETYRAAFRTMVDTPASRVWVRQRRNQVAQVIGNEEADAQFAPVLERLTLPDERSRVSQFDVYDRLTNFAQRLEPVERREVEAIAGSLVVV